MPTIKECGSCSLCCKLPGVYSEDKFLEKPMGQWCTHCDMGRGCRIYSQRPQPCINFRCLWLDNATMPDELRPDRCHVIMYETPETEGPAFKDVRGNAVKVDLIVMEDPGYYSHGESVKKKKQIREAVEHVKRNGYKVAVVNDGEARML